MYHFSVSSNANAFHLRGEGNRRRKGSERIQINNRIKYFRESRKKPKWIFGVYWDSRARGGLRLMLLWINDNQRTSAAKLPLCRILHCLIAVELNGRPQSRSQHRFQIRSDFFAESRWWKGGEESRRARKKDDSSSAWSCSLLNNQFRSLFLNYL